MGMDENTHRRLISRNVSNSPNQQHYYSNSNSSEHFQDTNRKKNINLKQIKNITTNCAKSITNKLITFSNSLTQNTNTNYYYSNNKFINTQSNPYSVSNPYSNPSTQGVNPSSQGVNPSLQGVNPSLQGVNTGYGYGVGMVPPGNVGIEYIYGNNKPNTIYSINNIINRIVNSEDVIRTHRELVIIIEYCLSFKDFLVEINVEKDRFGAPTMESINKFSIINHKIRDKILDYIRNRKDCCIFVVKFITWKMRCTKKPEEVILSLELLFSCLHTFGGYFLVLFTKSLMKTLRKLLFITNFKSSITSNVKKKITKILVGKSNYIHPGISTDIRIHIFKSKILYNIQLYYEIFLFEQDQYVVFYDGYKDMRLRGIKFPNISEQDKLLNIPHISNTTSPPKGATTTNSLSMSSNLMDDRIIGLEELDELLYNINNNNYTVEYINNVRNKLINSINILSNKSTLNNYQSQLLDKILKLNDSLLLLSHSNVTVSHTTGTGTTGTKEFGTNTNTNTNTTNNTSTKDTNEFGTNEFVSKEFGSVGPDTVMEKNAVNMDMENNMLELDEIFNFINFNEKNEQLIDEDDEDEEEEELINNFINLSTPKQIITSTNTTKGTKEFGTNEFGTNEFGTNEFGSVGPDTVTEKNPNKVAAVTNTKNTNGEDTKDNEKKKNISELVSELDNLEMDFGHMSMNNF